MKKQIKQLTQTDSLFEARDLIKCGYELEFQAVDGIRKGDGDDSEYDYEAARDYYLGQFDITDLSLECFNSETEWVYHLLLAHDEPEKILNAAGIDLYHDIYEDLKKDYVDREVEYDRDSGDGPFWGNNNDYTEDDIADQTYTDKHSECVDDCSVSGGEIRTIGGLKPSQFLESIKAAFCRNELEIDNRCSFHIHLSVNGIDHYYGQRMQAEMLAYILKHLKELPENVIKRIQGNHDHHKTVIENEKFTAINFHDDNKTWEFRLFGNVKTYAEAVKCLIMAYRALKHAYKAKIDKSLSLVPDLSKFSSDLSNRQRVTESSEKISNREYQLNELNEGA